MRGFTSEKSPQGMGRFFASFKAVDKWKLFFLGTCGRGTGHSFILSIT